MKKAMTVLGPVEADQLGHILPHEHILMEFPELNIPPMYPELVEKKVTIDMLGKLRRHIWSCKDNLCLDQPEIAQQEISSFKRSGGGTIVDVTPVGLGRSVSAVAEISRNTGVHIVAGCGFYIQVGHPAEIRDLSAQEIARRLVKEVEEGIEGTGIRAGIIGEVGVSSPMHPDEEKVLRGAVQAHLQTGAPLSIHQHGGNEIKQIHQILQQEGVSPQGVILSHMGSAGHELRWWAAGQGYYIEIDCFGNEYYLDALAGVIVRDPERVKTVKELIEKGYLRQILISNDVALKMLWKKYGGWSYEHILVNIKPFMLRQGIPPKAVDTMIYYNPMRVIAYLD